MPKPLKPTSIKFTEPQKRFLKHTAKAQGHCKISVTIKRLIDREMNQNSAA
jgi:hypothetical protein